MSICTEVQDQVVQQEISYSAWTEYALSLSVMPGDGVFEFQVPVGVTDVAVGLFTGEPSRSNGYRDLDVGVLFTPGLAQPVFHGQLVGGAYPNQPGYKWFVARTGGLGYVLYDDGTATTINVNGNEIVADVAATGERRYGDARLKAALVASYDSVTDASGPTTWRNDVGLDSSIGVSSFITNVTGNPSQQLWAPLGALSVAAYGPPPVMRAPSFRFETNSLNRLDGFGPLGFSGITDEFVARSSGPMGLARPFFDSSAPNGDVEMYVPTFATYISAYGVLGVATLGAQIFNGGAALESFGGVQLPMLYVATAAEQSASIESPKGAIQLRMNRQSRIASGGAAHGQVQLTGHIPSVSVGGNQLGGQIQLTGHVPVVRADSPAPLGEIQLTGHAPSTSALGAVGGSLNVTAKTPGLAISPLKTPVLAVSVAGFAPKTTLSAALPRGSVTLAGYAPALTQALDAYVGSIRVAMNPAWLTVGDEDQTGEIIVFNAATMAASTYSVPAVDVIDDGGVFGFATFGGYAVQSASSTEVVSATLSTGDLHFGGKLKRKNVPRVYLEGEYPVGMGVVVAAEGEDPATLHVENTQSVVKPERGVFATWWSFSFFGQFDLDNMSLLSESRRRR